MVQILGPRSIIGAEDDPNCIVSISDGRYMYAHVMLGPHWSRRATEGRLPEFSIVLLNDFSRVNVDRGARSYGGLLIVVNDLTILNLGTKVKGRIGVPLDITNHPEYIKLLSPIAAGVAIDGATKVATTSDTSKIQAPQKQDAVVEDLTDLVESFDLDPSIRMVKAQVYAKMELIGSRYSQLLERTFGLDLGCEYGVIRVLTTSDDLQPFYDLVSVGDTCYVYDDKRVSDCFEETTSEIRAYESEQNVLTVRSINVQQQEEALPSDGDGLESVQVQH